MSTSQFVTTDVKSIIGTSETSMLPTQSVSSVMVDTSLLECFTLRILCDPHQSRISLQLCTIKSRWK